MENNLKVGHDSLCVDIDTLGKILEDGSGVCHRYGISSIGANRIKIGYSNPNEYGTDDWVYAVYPIYSYTAFSRKTTIVVLDLVDVINDPHDEMADSFVWIEDEVRKTMGVPSVYTAIEYMRNHCMTPPIDNNWYRALQNSMKTLILTEEK